MTLPNINMGEIKSVKVDNWGVFFLQKLQNFFNKTDYCDLTLQFRDNSQLKVHRLVLSACTDYFNVLEQTCEVVDDAIIMPNGLQADVVVPIVNFMYTGTLEFELKMYNRLLRTAKDMNMTVLLKLLEAHRRTMEMHPQKTQTPTSPKARRKGAAQTAANLPVNAGGRSLIQPNQGKRIAVGSNVNTSVQQQRGIPPGNTLSHLPTVGPLPVKQQIGSTTFTRIKQENEQETNTPTQSGYTLLKQSPQQQQFQQHQITPTSPFEQLRKGYNNNKRPAVSSFISPPAKKPNLEDVKEFAEQQRMRKQIAAEYGDDADYDASNIMDDDNIHNDDDDDDMAGQTQQTAQTSVSSASAGVQTSAQQQQQSEDPPGTTTIIVKHEGPDKPPTIVVKDSSNSKMNHAKIISEVLRQYPHLVRSNKNIKLKIMPNASGQTQKIIVKKEIVESEKSPGTAPATSKLPTLLPTKVETKVESQPLKTLPTNMQINKPKQLQQPQLLAAIKTNAVQQNVVSKPQAVATTVASTTTTTPVQQPQKRRIDSKTMHALIALGAQNTTGPWLCLRCGRNGHPISIPSYRGFRRHLINTHKETIDPALCEHCGWRSASKRELHFHMQLEHKVKTNLYIFPECQLCNQKCIDSDGLNQHLIDSHPDENKQQCIYCNKIFPEELQLYTHMKTFHKKQALEDGIIDYSDDENHTDTLAMPTAEEYEHELGGEHQQQQQQEHEQSEQQNPEKKIKILSDISLPIASSIIKTESFSSDNANMPESTTAASEEYLQDQDHTETKFVSADGSEVILTDEQRKEILSQLNQEHDGSGVVMVLNEQQQFVGGETQSEQGAISHDETSQATTATNEEHEQDEEELHHDEPQTSHMDDESISQTATAAEAINEEEEEDHQHDDGGEGEHQLGQQPEHLDESKESMDNLEWAENLISEHDLADEVSQTTPVTAESVKPEIKQEEPKDDANKSQDDISKKLKELTGDWSDDENENMPEEEPMLESQLEKDEKLEVDKEPKDDDNKSQDEISNKLKELTGDWSDDEDEDMPEEEPMLESKLEKEEEVEKKEADKENATTENVEIAEPVKETDKIEKELVPEQEENKETEDKTEEVASSEREGKEEDKEKSELPEQDTNNIDEDDIDLALKSLHKDVDDEEEETETKPAEKEETQERDEEVKEEITEKSEELAEKSKELMEAVEEKFENIEKEEEKLKETDVKEEKSVKEIKTLEEVESSSVMEVDEETKKDLIDSLLKEQPQATEEDPAIETPSTTIKDDTKIEDDSKSTEKMEAKKIADELTETEPSIEDEFLDLTPVKVKIDEPSASTSATTTDVVDASSTTTTAATTAAKDTISSEDRVKSLISEWGDDDEDMDDNDDTDLTANL